MKNIFDYATKELSQDAFLIWLMENYEDDKIGDFAKYFLLKIICETGNVTDLKTSAQCKELGNVDVLIECKIDDKKVVVALEDKVFTGQHDNQLKRIAIGLDDKYKNDEKIYCVFYKTGFVTEKEKRDIEEINKSLEIKWKIYDSYAINKCFEEYFKNKEMKNILISMYKEHINNLTKLYVINDKDVIDKSTKEWSDKSNKWVALFNQFDQAEYDKGISFFASYWYKYILINNNDKFFSIEIRSNTLKDSKYSFKLVIYAMEDKFQTVENVRYFKRLCESKGVKPNGEGCTKQVASITKENINTVGEFKKALNEVINICKNLYNDFDENRLNFKETKK